MDEIRALPVGDLGLLVREVSFEITVGSSLQNDHLPNRNRSACSVDAATAKEPDWKDDQEGGTGRTSRSRISSGEATQIGKTLQCNVKL